MMSASLPEKTKPRVMQDPELFTENQSTAGSLPQPRENLNEKKRMWQEISKNIGPVYPVHGIADGKCTCKNSKCPKPGKHPWTEHGYKDASADPTQIEKWLREKPNCNCGIATGGELCVIDVDGPAGEEALLILQDEYGPLPDTWEVVTGRENGGRHLYFSKPKTITLKSRKIANDLECKAEGVGVVAPGSTHFTGRQYRVRNPRAEMQELPDAWLEFLSHPPKREVKVESIAQDATAKKGQRNDYLSPDAYRLLRLGYSQPVVLAAIRAKNETECTPPYSDQRIISMVDSAARNVPASQSGPKAPRLVTDTELIQLEVEPTLWIVGGMIAAGLCFLIGKAKVGKSLWALNLAYAIACANQFLGNFCTDLGDVIYLALEDGLARIQRRFLRVSEGKPSGRIYFQTAWPRFDEKGLGLDFLERELDRLPECRLVAIDTFQKIRAPKKSGKSDYEEDYRALEIIQQVALQRNIVIMLLHHLRKEKTEDPLDGMLGSTALSGAADSIIILDRPRHSNRGSLTVIGRDLEDGDLMGALELSADRKGIWKWIGPAGQIRKNENENKVLAVLNPQGASLTQIVKESGVPQTTCLDALHRLVEDGVAMKGQDKLYRPAPEPSHNTEGVSLF